MKKMTFVALMAAMTALTACSKPVTEVKEGETNPHVIQSAGGQVVAASQDIAAAFGMAPNAQPQAAASNPQLAKALKDDMTLLQKFSEAQAQKSAALQKQLEAAVQAQNQEQLKQLFPKFKAFMLESNKGFAALQFKTVEAQKLRQEIIKNNILGIDISEKMLFSKPNEQQVQALQQQAMQSQQSLMAITMDIQQKIGADTMQTMPQQAHAQP